MNYTNYLGGAVALDPSLHAKPKKRPTEKPAAFHNGWRVVGIPPGALEEARADHKRLMLAARDGGRMPKEWNEDNWLMNAKRKPVRSKPYEIPQAAQECKALAEKAGWLRVEIVELKKEADPGASNAG